MRAWLQGQSLSPPVLSDTARATLAQHTQGAPGPSQGLTSNQERHGQTQNAEDGRSGALQHNTSSGPLDDLSLSYFDPLCKSDFHPHPHGSSQTHSQCQQQHEQQTQQEQQRHLWATRLRALDAQRREAEKLLGLERGPTADLDVWAVYGALLEEYVRLRGD